jgi:hypothetical protein
MNPRTDESVLKSELRHRYLFATIGSIAMACLVNHAAVFQNAPASAGIVATLAATGMFMASFLRFIHLSRRG